MKLQRKNNIRELNDDDLIKRYNYLQSKEKTKGNRFSKYCMWHIRKRDLTKQLKEK